MKNKITYLIGLLMVVLVLNACSNESSAAGEANEDDKLKVVTSFTILEDLAREIGGEDVDIHNLVPTGTDPHEYEPLPKDMKKATDADILFYNGLNLEGGGNGWFFKMIDSVNQDPDDVYSLSDRIEPMYITDEETQAEEINPHAFISPKVGIKMAEDMRDAFIEKDPERKENYEKRADEYLKRLKDVEGEIKTPSFPSSIGLGSVSRSNSLSVMNGERSSLKTYRIPVIPTSEGVIEIPPAEVTTKDKVYYSEPLQLVVLPNPNYDADERYEERARELERTSPYKVVPPSAEKQQPQKSKQLPSKRKVIKI